MSKSKVTSEPSEKEAPNNSLQIRNYSIKDIVRLILNSWPCYQFAINNQLGGHETAAKDKWFCEVLADHLNNKVDLCAYELSDWMAEIINNEFNTISEDGTLDPTAKLLIQMRNWFLGKGQENIEEQHKKLDENIERLNAVIKKKNLCAPPQKVDDSSSDDKEGSEDDN